MCAFIFSIYNMYECMYYLSTVAKYSNLFQVPIDGARVVNVCMNSVSGLYNMCVYLTGYSIYCEREGVDSRPSGRHERVHERPALLRRPSLGGPRIAAVIDHGLP